MDKKKKILITGSAGFIGFSLALNLLKKGHKILWYDSINDYYDINLKYSRNKILKKFKSVEILWASVMEPYNFIQAKQLGCHIITVPPATIEKIENFGKSFDQLTIETVKAFYKDAQSANFKTLLFSFFWSSSSPFIKLKFLNFFNILFLESLRLMS